MKKFVARLQEAFRFGRFGRFGADRRQRFRPALEGLEDRLAPAAINWTPQGPTIIQSGQVEGMTAQNNPVIGAVQALAPHPTNANILYAGTVNGGIWMTSNALALSPTWTPLTDSLPTLAIGDIKFSPADPSNRTLYAGTGSFSNGALTFLGTTQSIGGQGQGVLMTTNGGTSWTLLGQSTFQGLNIRGIVPTVLNNGQTIFASVMVSPESPSTPTQAQYGLYQTTNGGTTWTNLSQLNIGLAPGPVSDIIADPSDPNSLTYYAAVVGQGVYRTTTGGQAWVQVNGTGASSLQNVNQTGNIRLSLHTSPNNNVLYAVTANAGGALMSVYQSTNQGAAWTDLGIPTYGSKNSTVISEDQGITNLTILADAVSPNAVFIGGDAQSDLPDTGNNANGCDDYVAVHAYWSSGLPTNWNFLECNNSGGTAPHADDRRLIYDAGGNILNSNDGGVYRLTSPELLFQPSSQQDPAWVAVTGNLMNTEIYYVAYDSLNNVVLEGAQDVGAARQIAANQGAFLEALEGDGYGVAVDNVSTPGMALNYFVDDGSVSVEVYNSSNTLVSSKFLDLNGIPNNLINKKSYTIVLNETAPQQILLPFISGQIYESLNQGQNFTLAVSYPDADSANAVFYGGMQNGTAFPFVLYTGLNNGTVQLRQQQGGTFTALNYDGYQVNDLVADPTDWATLYVASYANATTVQIMYAPNAANITAPLQDITGNLNQLTQDVFAIEAVNLANGNTAVLVGGFGGVFAALNPGEGSGAVQWIELGVGLPNVVVTDLVYNATDDILVAGTYGRGAWTIATASQKIGQALSALGETPAQNFVTSLYQDLLDRAPLPSELTYWENVLAQGISPTQVVLQIALSQEYAGLQIAAFYQEALMRAPDSGGLASWTAFLTGGGSLLAFQAQVLGSAEFFSLSGNTVAGFIPALYGIALSRAPQPNELTFWQSAFAAGATPLQVAVAVVGSSESYTLQIQALYQSLLNRAADPGGLASFVAALQQGASLQQVISGLAGSPEYYSDANLSLYQAWINQTYVNLLQRPALASDISYWFSAMQAGATPNQVALAITASVEYQTLVIQQQFYQQYLNRQAAPAEVQSWLAFLAAGGTYEGMAVAVASSPEYFQNAGGNSVSGFLNALWMDALSRPIDAPTAAILTPALTNGQTTRTEVAQMLFTSPEYLGVEIGNVYLLILMRPVDSAGLAYWTLFLQEDNSITEMIAAIASSNEAFGILPI